jgi:DsbC/DsbD-like thiol-disulfide interchange protein
MTVGNDGPRRPVAAWAVALTLCAHSGSSAAGTDGSAHASDWSGDARSAMRLIGGSPGRSSDAFRRAGIEIRLKPGWHTYWRYPGDAGVPPQIDFGGSTNVAAVHILWPAPQRIPEQGLFVIGYLNDVILPVLVAPQTPEQPIKLHLKIDYAVCEKLCVPVQAIAELELGNGASEWDNALAVAQASVPQRRVLREGDPIKIQSVRREATNSRIVVDVVAPANSHVDLFAEGPDAQWALPLPKRMGSPSVGVQRFSFDLDGAPPGASYEGAVITLTVAGEDPIEVSTQLD